MNWMHIDMEAKEFLEKFHKYLVDNYWGDIDPDYFKPIKTEGDIIDQDHVEIHNEIVNILNK